MARFTPDPSFYASPGAATAAPPEEVAYVATLNTGTNGDRAPDAITVLDVKEGSPTYGQLVGRLDMPNTGDELHHFGWNACSSALCPWAPHPHVERRYLLVPGLRSSRIHVIDVKDDPRSPKLVKVIEAEEIARKAGYSRPHTVHCGPDGIYVSALGDPGGDGPGGIFLLDHDDFTVKGQWEADRGPQELAYDFWWHLNLGTVITSEWGTPKMVEDGLVGELLLGQPVRPPAARLRPRRRASTCRSSTSAPSTRWCSSCARRTTPRKGYGFVGVVTSTADLSASRLALAPRRRRHGVGREGHHDPGRAGRRRAAPAAPAAVRRGPAAGHRHRAVRRRPAPARVLLGDGRAQALRRERPARAARDRLGAAGRDRRRAAAAPRRRRGQRRAADGRGLARRPARVPHQLALRRRGTPSSTRRGSTAGSSSSTRARTARSRSTRTSSSSTAASARTRCACRAVTRPRTPTASRTADGLAVAVGADGAARRLPRPEPGDGLAVRGRARDAGARPRRRAARAAADRGRPRGVGACWPPRSCSGSACSRTPRRCTWAPGSRCWRSAIFRFIKPRAHFRWVKARVSRGELAWWSFLMSTAHGAGLMVAPVLLGAGAGARPRPRTTRSPPRRSTGCRWPGAAIAVVLHVGAMLAVMGAARPARLRPLGRQRAAHGVGEPGRRVGRRVRAGGRDHLLHLARGVATLAASQGD